jgi:hypothetical protein
MGRTTPRTRRGADAKSAANTWPTTTFDDRRTDVPKKLSFGELRIGVGTHEDLLHAFPQLHERFRYDGDLVWIKHNPPCFLCGESKYKHANDQCLFAATKFTRPTDEEIYYYAVFGYFKGRHA